MAANVGRKISAYLHDDPIGKLGARLSAEFGIACIENPEIESSPQPSNKIIYWIDYSERSRKVMLNGEKQLARLNFNSTNELAFDYLYRNAGKRVTVKELEMEVLKEPLNKTLHAIVRDLGFTGALGQMFFDVSKSAIRFSNHITEAELEAFDISPDSILPH